MSCQRGTCKSVLTKQATQIFNKSQNIGKSLKIMEQLLNENGLNPFPAKSCPEHDLLRRLKDSRLVAIKSGKQVASV